MKDRTDIIRRVRQLLMLAKDKSNEHESKLALEKAEELSKTHKITMTELVGENKARDIKGHRGSIKIKFKQGNISSMFVIENFAKGYVTWRRYV